MVERFLQLIVFCASAFATLTIAVYLALMRNSRFFSAWSVIFIGFFSGSVAELSKLFLAQNNFVTWILHALGYLLISTGVIQVYQNSREREIARQQRQKLASIVADSKTMVDPITRLANRRQFETRAHLEFQQAVATQKPLSILALRVDDFKGKFSVYGQECADEILRTFAANISSTIRESPRGNDLAARTDSDQFEILLVGADGPIAHSVAERLLDQIQLNPLNWRNQYIHLNATFAFNTYPQPFAKSNSNELATSSAAQLILTVEDTLERACRMGPGKILQSLS